MGLCDSKLPPDSRVKKDKNIDPEKPDQILAKIPSAKENKNPSSNDHNPQGSNFIPLQLSYEICQEKPDPTNENIKLIKQTTSEHLFVLKYIFGDGTHLKKIISKVQEYSKLRFPYLAPILQHQAQHNQVLLRMNYYKNSLQALADQKYSKIDRLIILYRIARALAYLQKHGIRHNKIQISNIFLNGSDTRAVHIGLPSWNDPKEKETVSIRVLHIKSLNKLFATFFPQQTTMDEQLKTLMMDMKGCSKNQITIIQIIQRIFGLNCFDAHKREGFGLEIIKTTKEYYEGNFRDEKKNGLGIWEGPNEQIYIGSWKDNLKQGYGTYYDGKNHQTYEGYWQDDMKQGNGRQMHSNGSVYQGTFKNNLKEGKGHYTYPGKFQYDGTFKENSITGFGTFKDKDGNEYVGYLVGGEYEGKGKFTSKDKNYFYQGQWKSGAKHGEGEQISKDSVYIGSFVSNIRDGKGTLKESNETYIGQFKKGKITGKGEYCYENGDVYKGYFVDKIKQGKGTYVSAVDGSTFQGSWRKDKKHGKGKQTLKTGEYYDGDWVDSKRQGYGIQYIDQQNKYEGSWKNDKKQGKGVQLQSGNRYEGEFKNGHKHSSFATLVFLNDNRYQGAFVENKREGKGKFTWANGDEYVGDFLDDKRQGQGKMVYKQSEVSYSGNWRNDKRQGHGAETYTDGHFDGQFVNDKKHGKGRRTYIDPQGTCDLVGLWVNDLKHGEFQFFFSDGSYEKREYSNDRQMNLGMTAMPY